VGAHLEQDLLKDVDGARGAQQVERLAREEGEEDPRQEAGHQALDSGNTLTRGLSWGEEGGINQEATDRQATNFCTLIQSAKVAICCSMASPGGGGLIRQPVGM
jgi:hypothetical protein